MGSEARAVMSLYKAAKTKVYLKSFEVIIGVHQRSHGVLQCRCSTMQHSNIVLCCSAMM